MTVAQTISPHQISANSFPTFTEAFCVFFGPVFPIFFLIAFAAASSAAAAPPTGRAPPMVRPWGDGDRGAIVIVGMALLFWATVGVGVDPAFFPVGVVALFVVLGRVLAWILAGSFMFSNTTLPIVIGPVAVARDIEKVGNGV